MPQGIDDLRRSPAIDRNGRRPIGRCMMDFDPLAMADGRKMVYRADKPDRLAGFTDFLRIGSLFTIQFTPRTSICE